MLGDPSHVVARYGSMQERDAAAWGAGAASGKVLLWGGLAAFAVAVLALVMRPRS